MSVNILLMKRSKKKGVFPKRLDLVQLQTLVRKFRGLEPGYFRPGENRLSPEAFLLRWVPGNLGRKFPSSLETSGLMEFDQVPEALAHGWVAGSFARKFQSQPGNFRGPETSGLNGPELPACRQLQQLEWRETINTLPPP